MIFDIRSMMIFDIWSTLTSEHTPSLNPLLPRPFWRVSAFSAKSGGELRVVEIWSIFA